MWLMAITLLGWHRDVSTYSSKSTATADARRLAGQQGWQKPA
jgi:hypothetical protein